MFLRNDASAEKRYYNGKIGKIKTISNGQIRIICPKEPDEIVVEPLEWENINYTVNKENGEIHEDIIGKFNQFPLKPAWAITIHKSQGLTFDKAIIDSRNAFAHGQVYVALSRCKTFAGMVLSSPIPSRGIETDAAILTFVETARQTRPSENRLKAAKIAHQQRLLLACFDLQLLRSRLNDLVRQCQNNAGLVQLSGVRDMGKLREMAAEHIFKVSEKFKRQLRTIFEKQDLPESDAYILERIGKASKWFQGKFDAIFDDLVQKLQVETDNKALGKKIGHLLSDLKKEIAVKLAGIRSCEQGFSPSHYLRCLSNAEIDVSAKKEQKPRPPAYNESDIEHPELFRQLQDWRSRKAKQQGVAHFQILHQRVLIQIAVGLPDNAVDLIKINGVGKKTLEKYGEELLALVVAYRNEHGIDSVMLPEPKAVPGKTTSPKNPAPPADTKQISIDMFNKGWPIDRIAKERGLVESTIQGHLCVFVEKGELDINRLLSPEKQGVIEAAITNAPDNSLKAVKNELGDNYTYDDIRLMMAHRRHLASKRHSQ
jgi:hypothetical protein